MSEALERAVPLLADHFATLGFASAFDLPMAALDQAYFALQRQYHPDRYAARPPTERQRALLKATEINEAYRILKTSLGRARHLLALQGIFVGGERDTVKPSQALLTEMMELREVQQEAADESAREGLRERIRFQIHEVERALTGHFAGQRWPEAADATLRLIYLEKILKE